ncbi:MAG TPA: hypothetical protein DDZ88_28715 [Verrucomicrobiales bacterium]|nr:hypothetical protein [Verrucomicrobiales bacterium]
MNAAMRLFTLRLQPRHSISGAVVIGRKAIRPTGFRWPVSHRADLPASETAPWQSTAPTLHEKQIESNELTAVFDELLALREEKSLV